MTSSKWQYPGARWWKFDFHAHTPASADTAWGNIADPQHQLTPEQWLQRYMEAEIDCVAITDHNTGSWIDILKEAYAALCKKRPEWFREMTIFPGVELSVQGGIHLLAIFDPAKTTRDIEDLVARAEYSGTRGASDGVTRKSLAEVVELITSMGGLVIPAHADQEKGLLRLKDENSLASAVDANTLRQVLRSGHVLAMEWVDRNRQKPSVYVDEKIQWTEVLGSDCHNFRSSPKPGEKFTWVKMGRPSLEGLRLALHDGARLSIRRSDESGLENPNRVPEHVIESITISEARYMGRGEPQEIRFSPWFNAIVGGRGTGKSTVVHALRIAYRRESELTIHLPEEDPVRKTFEQFNRAPASRLDPVGALDYSHSKKTEIVVVTRADSHRRRLRWRQDGTGEVVEQEDAAGQWSPGPAQAITPQLFPVRIFSQGQIASLAGEGQQALLALIDEAAGVRDVRRRMDEEIKKYLALCARSRELQQKVKRKPEVLAQLEEVERKLGVLERGQYAEVLKEYQRRQRQNREVDRQLEDVKQLAGRLRTASDELALADVPEGLFDPEQELDREPLGILNALRVAVDKASADVREIADRLAEAAFEGRLAMEKSEWLVRSIEARTRYEELKHQLEAEGVSDPGLYGRLVQDRQRLAEELAKLEDLERQQEGLLTECEKQRQLVREVRGEITCRRKEFLAKALQGNNYVRMTLMAFGDNPRLIERELRESLGVIDDRFESDILTMEDDSVSGGIVAELLRALPEEPEERAREVGIRLESLAQRLQQAAAGAGDFGAKFNNYLKREGERNPEFIDKLKIWFPEDALRIEYSPAGDGKEFRSIRQASAGQRAAAMLAFLISYGDEPLVIDQPEDDLDNHLIYELVVRQIRENKLRRQLIVVTHNPNIVVNGDAELVHAFDYVGGQCRVVSSGSLQERAVREEVCRVMEGGREAFERRFYRIGKEI